MTVVTTIQRPSPVGPTGVAGHRPLVRIAALVAILAVTAGCSTQTSRSAQPEATSSSETSSTAVVTTPTGPPVVPAAAIKSMLLQRSELAAIVGDTDMAQVASYLDKPNSDTTGFDPFECSFRALAGSATAYYIKSRQALIGDVNRGARGQVANQVITAFADDHYPAMLLASAARGWKGCPVDEPFTVTDGDLVTWIPDQPVVTPTRISTTMTRVGDTPRTCRHVIAAQYNLVVDVITCGDGDTTRDANQIVDRILAKIPG